MEPDYPCELSSRVKLFEKRSVEDLAVSNGAVGGSSTPPNCGPQLRESSSWAHRRTTGKEPAPPVVIKVTFQSHGNTESQFGFDCRPIKLLLLQ